MDIKQEIEDRITEKPFVWVGCGILVGIIIGAFLP